MIINFKLSSRNRALVKQIADRYILITETTRDPIDIRMDLTACHNHGCPLDFKKLFNADDFNLIHDVSGIHNHLNKDTGELENCFRPRSTKK